MPTYVCNISSECWYIYMTHKIEIFGQNFAHFCCFHGSFLTIFWVKQVVFWTFSKLFRSCLGSVWALFSTLKCPLLGVFSARKIDKWPRKSRFWVKILPTLAVLRGHFWPFSGLKKSFSGLFQSCFGVVWEVFGHCCRPQARFWLYLSHFLYSLLPIPVTLLWGPAKP